MTARPMFCVLALLLLTACAPKPLSQSEVEDFVRQYFVAINAADSGKVLGVISQEPTVSSIAYGTVFQGWQSIRAVIEESVPAARRIEVTVGTIDVVPIGSDTALAVAPMKLSGLQVRRTLLLGHPGAMTIMVKRTPEGLRVVHEHYSMRPI